MAQVDAVTLDEALKTAQTVMSCSPEGSSEEKLAEWMIDTLAEAQPCTMEPPRLVSFGDGSMGLLFENGGEPLTTDEARAYAAMVLRQIDEAEEHNR